MKRILLLSALMTLFLFQSIAYAKVYQVKVPREQHLTVRTPCENGPAIFSPDAASVEGKGRIVTILAYNDTVITLTCKDGEAAYPLQITLVDSASEGKVYLEIEDPDYKLLVGKKKAIKGTSGYDKEQVIGEGRDLMVAMLGSAELSGYEIVEKSEDASDTKDKDISATLQKMYTGSLSGYVYEVSNTSVMKVKRHISDFSSKGVIFLYSPALDGHGNVVIPAKNKTLLYVIRAGENEEDAPRLDVRFVAVGEESQFDMNSVRPAINKNFPKKGN